MPDRPPCSRSVVVQAVGNSDLDFRLTGVYFAPAVDISAEMVGPISCVSHRVISNESALNHVVSDDSTPTHWGEKYAR